MASTHRAAAAGGGGGGGDRKQQYAGLSTMVSSSEASDDEHFVLPGHRRLHGTSYTHRKYSVVVVSSVRFHNIKAVSHSSLRPYSI